jgi:hypothetical protein
MPPLAIEIMLHYHYHGGEDDSRHVQNPSEVVRGFFLTFVQAGLLNDMGPHAQPRYRITDGGRFYVYALEEVPLPVQVMKWELPS